MTTKTEAKTPVVTCILLVDDDAMVLNAVASGLRLAGYAIDKYLSPVEALATFAKDPSRYSAVISDMEMPGFHGDELCRRCRAIDPSIPFILCSGKSEVFARARVCGASRAFQKPYSSAEMKDTLTKLTIR